MTTDHSSSGTDIDPVTLEVLRNRLEMVAEEMSANLIRASYSPNIKERKDASCAIFDAQGRLIAQADNVPGHLGAMPHSVRRLIEVFGAENFNEGDTVINNMPYAAGAGSHLPDITMVTPIVIEGTKIGYAGNLAHHADVGGSVPGSFAADNKSIFQEGLQIPPLKLYENDTLRDEIMEFILMNVRTPDERRGDLRAQYGSNRVGCKRFLELAEEWDVETLRAAFDALLDYSEARTRKSIRKLPDGEFSFSDTMDSDGRGTQDVQIAADVEIADSTVTVDLSRCADQVPGVINAPFSVTRATVYYVVRCVTDPEIPPNDGCYRPVSVVAPKGSVVRPQRPAAVAGGIETEQRIADVLFAALEKAGVRPAMAAANGSMSTVTFGGRVPSDGRPYTYYETIGGGYGARTDRDGVHGVHAHLTNTQNTPIEAFEMSYPLRVERYSLRTDTGGAGEYQGGMGIRRDIRVLDHVADFSLMSERRQSVPYGLAGGEPGARGADYHTSNGDRERIDAKTTRELQPNDLISVRTPGGGGYGSPIDRAEESIRRDLREDRISHSFIEEHYPQIDLDADHGAE